LESYESEQISEAWDFGEKICPKEDCAIWRNIGHITFAGRASRERSLKILGRFWKSLRM